YLLCVCLWGAGLGWAGFGELLGCNRSSHRESEQAKTEHRTTKPVHKGCKGERVRNEPKATEEGWVGGAKK
ncbi:hypothetical protein K438DRAFT_1818709, partial [Mycena galopus ATCC 62051]